MHPLLIVAMIAAPILVVTLYIVILFYLAHSLRTQFASARIDMDKLVTQQIQRVDGMTKQYRTLIKQVQSQHKLIADLGLTIQEQREYIENELLERVDEALLSVDAILDDSDDVDDYPIYVEDDEEDEKPVRQQRTRQQPKSQPTKSAPAPKQNGGGLAAVDAAAKKSAGTAYDRYQELRAAGYTAAEATAAMRNGNGKKGKR